MKTFHGGISMELELLRLHKRWYASNTHIYLRLSIPSFFKTPFISRNPSSQLYYIFLSLSFSISSPFHLPLKTLISFPNTKSNPLFPVSSSAPHANSPSPKYEILAKNLDSNPAKFLSSRTLKTLISCRSFHSFKSRRNRNPSSWNENLNPDELEKVIELIARDESDMEAKLSRMNLNLSVVLVTKIFHALNGLQISVLRFFRWVQNTDSHFAPNAEIYNLIVDNLGRVEDYAAMLLLFKELSTRRHCLTEKAFAFLSLHSSDIIRVSNSVQRVLETLNRVRGSCRSSGIYNLIKVLCALNHFDFAVYVMEETARKTSYYNILVAAKCKSSNFEEAQELFHEMRSFGCDPNVKSYNYLLGSLCKNGKIVDGCELLDKMENLGYLPDAITFEIVAVHACRLGRLDFAMEFLYCMMSEGIEPRIMTHAAFIKGYFWSGRAKDAYRYVIDMSEKHKCSANMNYSLMVELLHKSGRVLEAREILVEMIEKGLKPNFAVYVRVLKDLYKLGMGDLVVDLKGRFLRLCSSRERIPFN